MQPSSRDLRQVALLGGSFDPVHLGHQALAQAALQQLPIDALWWVPVGQAWQKSRALTPAHHRVAMLERALGNTTRQRIETCEIERGGPTYTIDTLDILSKRHPGVVWHLLLGWDQFINLPSWKDWQTVVARVRLAVVARPSQSVTGPLTTTRAANAASAEAHPGPAGEWPLALRSVPIERLHMAPWNVSSTAIRADVACGRPVLDRVSAPVARYIADHGLYRSA